MPPTLAARYIVSWVKPQLIEKPTKIWDTNCQKLFTCEWRRVNKSVFFFFSFSLFSKNVSSNILWLSSEYCNGLTWFQAYQLFTFYYVRTTVITQRWTAPSRLSDEYNVFHLYWEPFTWLETVLGFWLGGGILSLLHIFSPCVGVNA